VTRNAILRSGLGPRAQRAAADNGEFFPEFSARSISDEQQLEKPNLWVRLFWSATEPTDPTPPSPMSASDASTLPSPPPVAPEPERFARLEQACLDARAVLHGEDDAIAIQATLACLLREAMPHTIFCGFYRRTSDAELTVGPYQGSLGCLRIALSRGVCGRAARTGETQRVADVHALADHIACDARARSELVVPVRVAGRVMAVLDLDAAELDAFSEREATTLEGLLAELLGGPRVRW
jgi:GAF domain-containing protein